MARRAKAARSPAPPANPCEIPGLLWADRISVLPQEWLWPCYIPRGCLVLLEGRKGTGKSSLAAAIAAAVTTGQGLPVTVPSDRRAVVWDAGEDSWAHTVLPRLIAAGAHPQLVGQLRTPTGPHTSRRIQVPTDLEWIAEVFQRAKVGALICDPWIGILAPGIDVRAEQDVRTALEPLGQVCADAGVLGLLTRHVRKGSSGDLRDAGLGSVAVGNTARMILRTEEHPHERGIYCLAVVASNCGARPPAMTYRIVGAGGEYPSIQWVGATDLDADAIAEGRGSTADRDEWGDAERLIAQAIGSCWIAVGAIEAESLRAGISPRTLRRAKAQLGVPSRRVQRGAEGHWEWGPPPAGWPAGLALSE